MISKKIILTEKELYDLISEVYEKGFWYGQEHKEHWIKNRSSKGRDVLSFTEKKLKEILK